MPTQPLHPLVKWAVVLVLSALCALLSSRLEIRQNVQDMLPDSISKGEVRLLSRLGLINRIFITVQGPDFQTVSASASRLGEALSESPVFRKVIFRLPDMFDPDAAERFLDMLPAVLDADDLTALSQTLTADSIEKALMQDFLLLNSPAGPGFKEYIQHDPLGFIRFYLKKMEALKSGSRMQVRDGMFTTPDGRACMLWAETDGVLTDSANAEQVKAILDDAAEKALLPGCCITLIGTLPHTLANARMVNRDLRLLLTFATLAIIILFYLFTRDLRSLFLILIPLLSAPFAIVAAALFSDWKVSGIALAFGIVLIGIAVDFAVHIYMRAGDEKDRVRKGMLSDPVMRSIFMAYLTTAGVFVVLLFSQIPTHRQMALMAITGLSVALLLAVILVPGMAGGKGAESSRFSLPMPRFSPSSCRAVLVLWVVIMAAGAVSWSHVRYNGDIREFDVKTPDITASEERFRKLWGTVLDQIMVVAAAPDLDGALDLNDRVSAWLKAHDVRGVRSVSILLPGPLKQRENISRWEVFWKERLSSFRTRFDEAAEKRGFSRKAFSPFWRFLEKRPEPFSPDALLKSPEGSLLSGMVRRVDEDGEDPGEVYVITLVSAAGAGMAMLQDLKVHVPDVHIFSGSGWKSEMEAIMRADIRQMCTGALVLVTLIVWLFFRDLSMVLAALVPVISALAVMAIYTLLSGDAFNMMHLLMGIMVTGLSIDYGIFMARAVRDGHATLTSRAVMLCALSTISGFGVLAFSHHPVLKSLGETVLAGIGASLPAAMFVTPCIMQLGKGKGECSG